MRGRRLKTWLAGGVLAAAALALLPVAAFAADAPAPRIEAFVQLGHAAEIDGFTLSADGRYAASRSSGQLKLWDLRAGRELRDIRLGSLAATAMAFMRSGPQLLVGGWEDKGGIAGLLAVFDLASGERLRQIALGPETYISALALSPDGSLAAVGVYQRPEEGEIRIFRLATGEQVGTLGGHAKPVAALAFSPDGKRLASGADDQSLRLWDVASGKQLMRIALPDLPRTLAYAPDGGQIAVVLRTASGRPPEVPIRLFDAVSGAARRSIEKSALDERQAPGGAVFSADGAYLLVTLGKSAIEIKLATGTVVRRFPASDWVRDAPRYLADGRVIAAAGRQLLLWQRDAGALLAEPPEASQRWALECAGMATLYSVHGRFRASCTQADGLIVAAMPEGPRVAGTGTGRDPPMNARVLSDDGRRLAGWDGGRLTVWQVADGKPVFAAGKTDDAQGGVLALSADGAWLAEAGRALPGAGGVIRVWDLARRKIVATLAGHADAVKGLVFALDGRRLSSVAEDGTLRQWSLPDGQLKMLVPLAERLDGEALGSHITALAVSPDQRLAAVSMRFGQFLEVVDLTVGRSVYSLPLLPREKNFPVHAHFSADGQSVVLSHGDGWEQELALTLRPQTLAASATQPSQVIEDARTGALLVFDGDGAEAEWDRQSGALRATGFYHGRPLEAAAIQNSGEVVSASTRDGRQMLLTRRDGGRRELTTGGAVLGSGSVFVAYETMPRAAGGKRAAPPAPAASAALAGLAMFGADAEQLAESQSLSHVLALAADGRRMIYGVSYGQATAAAPGADSTTRTLGRIYVWDRAQGKIVNALGADLGAINALELAPDQRSVFVLSQAPTVAATEPFPPMQISQWDLASGKRLRLVDERVRDVRLIRASPDGRLLAVAEGTGNDWLRIYDLRTGKHRALAGPAAAVRAAAFSPDGRYLAAAGDDRLTRLWETRNWKLVASMTGHAGEITTLGFSADGGRIYSAATDNTTRVWSVTRGEELVRLIHFKDGAWVAMTPEGYFNASPGGAEQVGYRRGLELISLDQLFDVFYRPDLVQRKLAGEDLRAYITITAEQALEAPPPVVKLEQDPTPDAEGRIVLRYTVDGAEAGVGEVRIFHNGKLVHSEGYYRELPQDDPTTTPKRGKKKAARELPATPAVAAKANPAAQPGPRTRVATLRIDPVPGENTFGLTAFNRDNTVQSRVESMVVRSTAPVAPPRLFILAVGINRYVSRKDWLNFAAKDAQSISQVLGERAVGLFGAGNIETVLLTDGQATKPRLVAALQETGARMRPQDTLVVFVAAHGVIEDGTYAIVTQEYDGYLRQRNMITSRELIELSKNARGLKQLWILDTCHSGGFPNFLGGLYDARLTVMTRNVGMHTFAAASSTQEAIDGYRGNGLFTHALLQGLGGHAADRDRDGTVSAFELGDFGRDLTMDISRRFKNRQTPLIMKHGEDMPLSQAADGLLDKAAALVQRLR